MYYLTVLEAKSQNQGVGLAVFLSGSETGKEFSYKLTQVVGRIYFFWVWHLGPWLVADCWLEAALDSRSHPSAACTWAPTLANYFFKVSYRERESLEQVCQKERGL